MNCKLVVAPLEGSTGPIVPVLIGDAGRTMQIARSLEVAGFLVGAIRPPTVPRGAARLRISVTAAHTPEDVRALAAAVADAMAAAG